MVHKCIETLQRLDEVQDLQKIPYIKDMNNNLSYKEGKGREIHLMLFFNKTIDILKNCPKRVRILTRGTPGPLFAYFL